MGHRVFRWMVLCILILSMMFPVHMSETSSRCRQLSGSPETAVRMRTDVFAEASGETLEELGERARASIELSGHMIWLYCLLLASMLLVMLRKRIWHFSIGRGVFVGLSVRIVYIIHDIDGKKRTAFFA